MPAGYQKSGYLTEEFRIFHNADEHKREIPFHYHDFHKLLLFLSGNVSYIIEGRQSVLVPGDVVIVRAGQIHRPVIHDNSPYERIIFYIDPGFFDVPDRQILNLFREDLQDNLPDNQRSRPTGLLRLAEPERTNLKELAARLKSAAHDTGYAADMLRRVRLLELLIFLSRSLRTGEDILPADITANPFITAALDYIHAHLEDDSLDINAVAEAVALNRS